MTNMNEKKLNLKQNIDFIRILIYAAIVGLVAGTIGTLFTVCVNSVINLRIQYPWLTTTRWCNNRATISTSKI